MPSSAMAPKHGTEANGIKASSDTCSGFLHIGRMHCEACPGDQRGHERCHEQGPPHRTIAPASPALLSHLSFRHGIPPCASSRDRSVHQVLDARPGSAKTLTLDLVFQVDLLH